MRFLLCGCLFFAGILNHRGWAQCPDRAALNRLLHITHSADAVQSGLSLRTLLDYEQNLKPCMVPKDSLYDLLLQRIGESYGRTRDYLHAIQYTRQSIENDSGPGNPWLVQRYYQLAQYYDSLKWISRKNEAIDSCIAKEIRMDTGYYFTCKVLTDRVESLYFRGEYNLCYQYAALGERLIPAYYHSGNSMEYIVFFLTYQADALYSLNRFSEEEQLLKSKGAVFLKEKNKVGLAIVYGLLGFVNKSRNNYEQAIRDFRKAFQTDVQTKKKSICAQALYQQGKILSENLGRYEESLDCFKQALPYSFKIDSFYVYGNMAHAYAQMNQFEMCRQYFQKSFDQIRPGIDEQDLGLHIEDYVSTNSVEYILGIVLDKADACLREYRETGKATALPEALRIYRTADKLLNSIKDAQVAVESKLFWRGYARKLYEHAIEACLADQDSRSAFYFFEKSRAILLNDQLSEQNRLTEHDLLERSRLQKKILEKERHRTGVTSDAPDYIQIQHDLIILNQDLDRLDQAIRLRDPQKHPFSDTLSVSPEDVRKNLLQDHSALIELFNGDSAMYALLITPDTLQMEKIDKKDGDRTIRLYNQYLSRSDLINAGYSEFVEVAHHAYDLFFKRFPEIKGRVIISPDGPYFPIEALVTDKGKADPVYFVLDHAVSYTYSARYLLNKFGAREGESGKFLGVAPLSYPFEPSLPALPGSDRSLAEIGSYFSHAQQLLAAQATRAGFLGAFFKYDIIQLYTHAADSSERNEPVIHFVDSALYLSELIPENKPFTRLIVLSACETASGTSYGGEGVFSFNRAFAALGIPAALSNLWAVENKSTYQLTELFYKFLAKGLPTDIALQKAKLEFMQTAGKGKSLPYYWAGIILAGKTEVLELNDRRGQIYTGAILLLFLGLGIWIWRVLRKRKTPANEA